MKESPPLPKILVPVSISPHFHQLKLSGNYTPHTNLHLPAQHSMLHHFLLHQLNRKIAICIQQEVLPRKRAESHIMIFHVAHCSIRYQRRTEKAQKIIGYHFLLHQLNRKIAARLHHLNFPGSGFHLLPNSKPSGGGKVSLCEQPGRPGGKSGRNLLHKGSYD